MTARFGARPEGDSAGVWLSGRTFWGAERLTPAGPVVLRCAGGLPSEAGWGGGTRQPLRWALGPRCPGRDWGGPRRNTGARGRGGVRKGATTFAGPALGSESGIPPFFSPALQSSRCLPPFSCYRAVLRAGSCSETSLAPCLLCFLRPSVVWTHVPQLCFPQL